MAQFNRAQVAHFRLALSKFVSPAGMGFQVIKLGEKRDTNCTNLHESDLRDEIRVNS